MTQSPTVLKLFFRLAMRGCVLWILALLSFLLRIVAACCRLLIKHGLQQCGDGDGRPPCTQVSQCYEQAETRFFSSKVFWWCVFS